MAAKRTGISRDLIIHPGETIADVLEERGITQAELATRTGVTPAYVSNVIAGKKDISSNFAMALEYALDVPKSFWLNLQANYDAELLELNEANTITEAEKAVFPKLHQIIGWLREVQLIPSDQDREHTILSLRKALRISDISKLEGLGATGAFRISKNAPVDPVVMGAWLKLCQVLGERDTRTVPQFNAQNMEPLISDLKSIMLDPKVDLQKGLANVMARYGIKFSVVHNFRGAPVHGYISQNKDGEYQMVLTIRGAFADIFWFSLFHELGHIVNGDISKSSGFIDVLHDTDMAKEAAADKFACDVLLSPESYTRFVARKDFSIGAILQYAHSQRVAPFIVIGRLQKEKRIPYSWHSDYKVRYKWAES